MPCRVLTRILRDEVNVTVVLGLDVGFDARPVVDVGRALKSGHDGLASVLPLRVWVFSIRVVLSVVLKVHR